MSRVLVAEDSTTQAQAIRLMLEARGFLVEVQPDGKAALAAVLRNPPDLVLTDLDMPNMDGLELVEAVRNSHPHLPVILMTAFGSEEIAMKALQRGATSYVPKRILNQDLVETLEGALTLGQAERDERRLWRYVAKTESEYEIANDPALAPAVVAHIQQGIEALDLFDETELLRIGVALEQAIYNAMLHGNLELSTDQLRDSYQLEDGGRSYDELIRQRREESPYCDRRVEVSASLSRDAAICRVRNQGPGYQPPALSDRDRAAAMGDIENRGFHLMAAFMDEIQFNPAGNEVTLTKRRQPAG